VRMMFLLSLIVAVTLIANLGRIFSAPSRGRAAFQNRPVASMCRDFNVRRPRQSNGSSISLGKTAAHLLRRRIHLVRRTGNAAASTSASASGSRFSLPRRWATSCCGCDPPSGNADCSRAGC